MKVIGKSFGKPIEILKFNDFKGAACMVSESTGTCQEVGGRKILKAGTPYPSNDASCLGFLLHDVDVTDGERPATYIYEGAIKNSALTANGVTVAELAKSAVPRVTFFD